MYSLVLYNTVGHHFNVKGGGGLQVGRPGGYLYNIWGGGGYYCKLFSKKENRIFDVELAWCGGQTAKTRFIPAKIVLHKMLSIFPPKHLFPEAGGIAPHTSGIW